MSRREAVLAAILCATVAAAVAGSLPLLGLCLTAGAALAAWILWTDFPPR